MHEETVAAALDRAASRFARADALRVGAWAGMGVDSGLPRFRGAQGFRNACPAPGAAGIACHGIASPDAFAAAPRLAWGCRARRLNPCRRAVSHAGFALLRRRGAVRR